MPKKWGGAWPRPWWWPATTPSDRQLAQEAFNRDWFRVYTSPDHLGVELGGSLKNVVAIAAGVADGLGLGDNAKAALITRGLAEMTRLGVAMGANAATFAGLSGAGDLVVTCMSRHSRNRSIGERLGKGEKWSEISKTFRQAVEGTVTARSAVELAAKYHVELPIAAQVHAILYEGKGARQALKDLLNRPVARRRPEMTRGRKAPEMRYSIEEVSDLTGLKQHVLRYWENEFPQLRPERTRSNQRLYRQKDVDLILHIKQLVYDRKFTLQGAREQLDGDLKEARSQGQVALELDLEQSQLMGTLIKARRQARSLLELLDKSTPGPEPEA